MAKISVVMPVRNNEQYLDESIQSILKQTEQDYEFLIFADRCKDSSIDILNQYKDKRIKIYTDSNIIGVTAALNFLISKATTDIIARQDADDISATSRLQIFFEEKKDTSLTTSNIFLLQQNNTILEKKIDSPLINLFQFLFFYNFKAHGQLFFKKQYYNNRFKYSQDYELCSNVLRNNYRDYHLIDTPLYTYRKHGTSLYNYHRSKQIYFSLLTSQQNIKHFLDISLPLSKVLDLRNYFLENKKPKKTSSTLFLSLINSITDRFNNVYSTSHEERDLIDRIIQNAYTSAFINSQ